MRRPAWLDANTLLKPISVCYQAGRGGNLENQSAEGPCYSFACIRVFIREDDGPTAFEQVEILRVMHFRLMRYVTIVGKRNMAMRFGVWQIGDELTLFLQLQAKIDVTECMLEIGSKAANGIEIFGRNHAAGSGYRADVALQPRVIGKPMLAGNALIRMPWLVVDHDARIVDDFVWIA